ncbi:MAG: hypothetical protein NW217_15990 [Hyphomicrobiaceae bacterium]|nr:hypothetical protein [Hyphomicrobiaceae bacterium]
MNSPAFMKVDKATFYDFVARHDDQRFEYEGGYIVQQMTGGTLSHGKIVRNLLTMLTRQLDLRRKPPEYMALPSLVAYVVASQDAPALLAWVRDADGTFPAEPAEFSDDEASLSVPTLGVGLALKEIFAGITFSRETES